MESKTRVRRSIEDRIADLEEKAKVLREKKKLAENKVPEKVKPVVLKKDSPGIADLLNQIDIVSKLNNIKVPELIKKVSSFKHTGLKFEPKKPK